MWEGYTPSIDPDATLDRDAELYLTYCDPILFHLYALIRPLESFPAYLYNICATPLRPECLLFARRSR